MICALCSSLCDRCCAAVACRWVLVPPVPAWDTNDPTSSDKTMKQSDWRTEKTQKDPLHKQTKAKTTRTENRKETRTEEVEIGWRKRLLVSSLHRSFSRCFLLFAKTEADWKQKNAKQKRQQNKDPYTIHPARPGSSFTLKPPKRQVPKAMRWSCSPLYWVFVFSHDPLTKNAARVFCQCCLFVDFLDLLSRSAPSGNLWHAYTVDQNARFARSKRHRPSSPSRHPDRRRIVGSIDRPTTTSSINDNSVRSPNGYCVSVRACISEDR